MRRLILALPTIAVAVALYADPAAAAKPNNQACLGVDASTGAQVLRPYSHIISGIATTAAGAIGEEVQLHLAGEIPDSVFPSTCND
ncbi:MAG: hypothetical protein ACRD29_21075 [Acidimicrobiales bacterium]